MNINIENAEHFGFVKITLTYPSGATESNVVPVDHPVMTDLLNHTQAAMQIDHDQHSWAITNVRLWARLQSRTRTRADD